jgi:peptidoglycan hydrolase-like protein with peptidoglycan-binding domain
MTRWTFVALAITLSACNKGERDQTAQNKSDTAATAADSARSADATTARTMSSDTATAKPSAGEKATIKAAATTKPAATGGKTEAPAGTEAARNNGVTGTEAMTGVHAAAAPGELSADQVKQLQAALKKAGCYSGTPDGVSGPGTQRAIECGLKKYKLGPNDTGELYRKLGLKF